MRLISPGSGWTELDVPTALDIAEEAGDDAARLVLHTLALS